MILVVGCGRTGTCLMGRILASHPQVRGYVESPEFFPLATRIAFGQRAFLPTLIERYRAAAAQAAPRHFADKSHPNLWQVEELLAAFPKAKFVAMLRGVEATVASMLKHGAFAPRAREAARVGRENRFLGITKDNRDWYGQAEDCERLAQQWKAHTAETHRLLRSIHGTIHPVWYDELVVHPKQTLEKLRDVLALDVPFPAPKVHTGSLLKWRGELSDAQIAAIRGCV